MKVQQLNTRPSGSEQAGFVKLGMKGSPIKKAISRREPSTPQKQTKTTDYLLTPGSTPTKVLKIDFSGQETSDNELFTPTKKRKSSVFTDIQATPKLQLLETNSTEFFKEKANESNQTTEENSVFYRGKALFQRGSKIRKIVGRETERVTIREKLLHCIKTHTNGALYISGLPGTGKSGLVSEILQEIGNENAQMNIAQINCMTIDKPDQTYSLIAKEFGYLERRSHIQKETAIDLLRGEFIRKDTSHILILDELDRIVTANQEVLFKIFEWACGCGHNLVVIGIANAIDLTDRFLPRLQAHKLKPEVIAFKPYTSQEITAIIEARLKLLGSRLMHAAAVRICSAKTAANSGDLRKAFDICRRAIEVVEEEHKQDPTFNAIVTTRHVAKVCQSVFGGVDAKERLCLLNFQQRAVLCVLMRTEKYSLQPNVTVLQAFQEYELRCAHNPVFNALTYPEYVEVVNALESAGLVAVTGLCGKKGLGTHGNVRVSRGGGGAAGSKGAEGYRDEFGLRKISSRAQLIDVINDLAENDPLRSILIG